MKKLISIALLLNTFVINALASGGVPIINPISDWFKDVPTAITTISFVILPLATLVLFVILVVAGFVRMTAAGDAEKEKKAMQIIQSAITGFIIIALAGLIISAISAILGIKIVQI